MSQAKSVKFTPEVGQIIVSRCGGNNARSPGKIIEVNENNVRVLHGSGVPRFLAAKTLRYKYKLASPEDVALFVDESKVDSSAPDIGTDEAPHRSPSAAHKQPSTPPAANDTPPSQPPAPQPAAANDGAAAALAKVDVTLLEYLNKQNQSNLESLERRLEQQMVRQEARFMSALKDIVASNKAAPASVPASVVVESPKKGKDADKDAINKEIIGRETSWAEPLIKRFIAAELEVVAFDSEANISRAMLPGEFHDALVVWCQQNGEPTPDPRTTFFLLDDRISPTRHGVKDGQSKKRKTMFARRRQMNLDLSGDGEFVEVMSRARSLWPTFKEDSTVALRIKTMLSGQGRRNSVTKEEMFEAIRGAALESKRKNVSVFPETVFGNPGTVRVYAKLAADFGGAK